MGDNDTYKIESYTDDQCFEVLGLNNPTDRELEMTILKFMDKYEDKSKRLYHFFESMYDRFFSPDDDDEEIEGFEAPDLKIDPTTNALYSTDAETFAKEKKGKKSKKKTVHLKDEQFKTNVF